VTHIAGTKSDEQTEGKTEVKAKKIEKRNETKRNSKNTMHEAPEEPAQAQPSRNASERRLLLERVARLFEGTFHETKITMGPGGAPLSDEQPPIQLTVEYQRLNTFFYDYSKNISQGGTFISTAKPLPVGTLFRFDLRVPELETPLHLHAEVRWIVGPAAREETVGRENGMGIRFVYEGESQQTLVHQKVKSLMQKNLGPVITQKMLRSRVG